MRIRLTNPCRKALREAIKCLISVADGTLHDEDDDVDLALLLDRVEVGVRRGTECLTRSGRPDGSDLWPVGDLALKAIYGTMVKVAYGNETALIRPSDIDTVIVEEA